MKTFGLLGRKLGYSFSRQYFTGKFERENLFDFEYKNFELEEIAQLPKLLEQDAGISGLNVTIPFKEEVFPFLDLIDDEAGQIGAVNTIKLINEGDRIVLKGYNTDVIGFRKSLESKIKVHHTHALILGAGGAAKAVQFVLNAMGIEYTVVSRKSGASNTISYADLGEAIIAENPLIVNTTPLGTFPKVDECPDLPYGGIDREHLLFDLIYNPAETLFLKKGRLNGAETLNGLKMLEEQAEASWSIWND